MQRTNLTRIALACSLGLGLTLTQSAVAQDNRTFAMGGAGVANGNYYQAASLNPALVAAYEDRDHFGLILPSLYAEATDEDEVFDAVDDFQDSFDRLENLLQQWEQGQDVTEGEVEQARQQVAQDFGNIEGTLVGRLGGQLALAIPNRFAAMQFFANAELEAFGAPLLDEGDVDILLDAESMGALDELNSEGFVVGRLVTDLGVAIGSSFSIGGRDIRWGIAPKLQEVESYTYFSALTDIDEDDFDSSEYRSSSSEVNLDLGLSMELTERLSAGLTLNNAISHTVEGQPTQSNQFGDLVTLDYEIEPHAVAGLGYNTQRMSLSLDVDITTQNYLGMTDESQLMAFGQVRETQFVRAGYEYNVANWVQVRRGYRHDLEDTYEDAITAGLGLSPFGRLHLNVSAMYIDDRSFGAGAQLMFTF